MFDQIGEQSYPPSLALFQIILGICGVAWLVYLRIAHWDLFPNKLPQNTLFHERMASGRSLKNVFTRFGGANRCLELVVIPGELWIRLNWIFRLIFTGAEFDLLHRIRVDQVKLIKPAKLLFIGQGVSIEYADRNGIWHIVELLPSNLEKFKVALEEAGFSLAMSE